MGIPSENNALEKQEVRLPGSGGHTDSKAEGSQCNLRAGDGGQDEPGGGAGS